MPGQSPTREVDRRVDLRMRRHEVRTLDTRADIDQYASVMDRLCAQIEPVERTAAVLGEIRAEL